MAITLDYKFVVTHVKIILLKHCHLQHANIYEATVKYSTGLFLVLNFVTSLPRLSTMHYHLQGTALLHNITSVVWNMMWLTTSFPDRAA